MYICNTKSRVMKQLIFIIIVLFQIGILHAQNLGTVKGKVIDVKTRIALPDVNIVVEGTRIGTITNAEGEFVLENVPLGYIKIEASYIGYISVTSEAYLVTQEKTPFIFLELTEDEGKLEEVVVTSRAFKKSIETPLSLQSFGVTEIEKNPGGNRDILKVIQSFPGVASNPGFRNDIIIRGGATAENKFYVDGIEVPVINHFQTQGATGGPVGIINADLIRKVDFYASAFPANRGNALSSIIEFTQKNGNRDGLRTRATLGTSDAGITLDGPLGKQTTFMLSARQSYLQFLFKLIKLPFLPTYNDFQLNIKSQLSDNSQLTIVGLGAIDNFKLNESVNDGVTDEETIKRNRYILGNIPVQKQWNYTIGANYKRFGENNVQQIVLSRNEWSNISKKYFNNTGSQADLLLDYDSKEVENKLRLENLTTTEDGYKINLGVGLETTAYTNSTFRKLANTTGTATRNFSSRLDLFKYAAFGQLSKKYLGNRLGVSFGFRLDGIDYNAQMKNPFNQFSPRLAMSYILEKDWTISASAGRYYQLPSYTILGFRNNVDQLVNQKDLKYISVDHWVAGLEYRPDVNAKITLEGFYKNYRNYPFSVRDQISLANLGADFGVVGNEQVTSTSTGRAYGFELLAQKKSFNGLYGIASYTFVRSEFKGANNLYLPSTWDNRHLLTITAGTKLKKNWEIGGKFRLVGGRPFTPYDLNASATIANYDITNRGILDYSRLNSERFSTYTQLDIRVDKTWYWKSIALNVYVDVQNLYGSKAIGQSYILPRLDANGNKLINPNDATKYVLEEVENSSGNVLPRFGVIVDF